MVGVSAPDHCRRCISDWALMSTLIRLRMRPRSASSGTGSSTWSVHPRSVPKPPSSQGKSKRDRIRALLRIDDHSEFDSFYSSIWGATSSSSKRAAMDACGSRSGWVTASTMICGGRGFVPLVAADLRHSSRP